MLKYKLEKFDILSITFFYEILYSVAVFWTSAQ